MNTYEIWNGNELVDWAHSSEDAANAFGYWFNVTKGSNKLHIVVTDRDL